MEVGGHFFKQGRDRKVRREGKVSCFNEFFSFLWTVWIYVILFLSVLPKHMSIITVSQIYFLATYILELN